MQDFTMRTHARTHAHTHPTCTARHHSLEQQLSGMQVRTFELNLHSLEKKAKIKKKFWSFECVEF